MFATRTCWQGWGVTEIDWEEKGRRKRRKSWPSASKSPPPGPSVRNSNCFYLGHRTKSMILGKIDIGILYFLSWMITRTTHEQYGCGERKWQLAEGSGNMAGTLGRDKTLPCGWVKCWNFKMAVILHWKSCNYMLGCLIKTSCSEITIYLLCI